MIKKIIKRLYRNRYRLDKQKAIKNRINLEWWSGCINLGDTLAVVIVTWMLEKKEKNLNTSTSGTVHFMTVGSLIGKGRFDATVWGSGTLKSDTRQVVTRQRNYRKYDIRAVRGPITRKILIDNGYECPEVYGDPGILMPLIYQAPLKEKKYAVSVILHHKTENCHVPEDCHMINIKTDDYKFFINEIALSEKIISSSLHGIILAESYGVPAVFLSKGIEEQFLKFQDWYYSTNRNDIRIANSLEEARFMEPMPLPDLSFMRDDLLKSFPYDLWD